MTNDALKPDNVESCLRASGQTSASGYGDGSIAALDRTTVVSRWSWWTSFRVKTTTLEPHTTRNRTGNDFLQRVQIAVSAIYPCTLMHARSSGSDIAV